MRGIAEWLASIGLGEYTQRFAANAIDLSVVRDLTEQDLKDLGVLLGHRRKILRAIAELDSVGGIARIGYLGVPPETRVATGAQIYRSLTMLRDLRRSIHHLLSRAFSHGSGSKKPRS
jgi:hypothetical protein